MPTTTDIPKFKAKVGTEFSLMHPKNRAVVTGVGKVVSVEKDPKSPSGVRVIFEILKGIFIGPV